MPDKTIAIIHSESPLICLQDKEYEDLLELAGFDYYVSDKHFEESVNDLTPEEIKSERELYLKSKKFIQKITYTLSLYPDLVSNLDYAPTPNETRIFFEKLALKAETLLHDLTDLSPHNKAYLKNIKHDTGRLFIALQEFAYDARTISSKTTKESRGRKESRARKAIVHRLSSDFDEFAVEESKSEKSKLEFIGLALSYAKIPIPKNIKTLIYRSNEKPIIIKRKQ